MAHRRPLASHPAFVPLIAAWLGALCALVVAVAPIEWLAWAPFVPGVPMRAGAAALAGIGGLVFGAVLARFAARRHRFPADRSLPAPRAEPLARSAVPRPLRINEEVASRFEDLPAEAWPGEPELPLPPTPAISPDAQAIALGTPNAADPLARMVERFDRALDSYARRIADQAEFGPDAMRRFVASQTGTPDDEARPIVPDHQAELRRALDKLAELHGRG